MIGLAAVAFLMFEPAQISIEARGNAIVGRASVIAGDTLDICGTRIRLYAIDPPEKEQLCEVGRTGLSRLS
jgi:endonuclease YncB( thermonuclease family)